MLAEIRKHEIIRDRRRSEQSTLAPFALDVIFAGKCKTPERLHTGLAGAPGGFGGEQFGHIGLWTAASTDIRFGVFERRPIKQCGCLSNHEFRCLGFGVNLGEWKLDCLILADRSSEHGSFVRVGRGPAYEVPGVAEGFGCEQYPFSVHAIENIAEPFTLFAYEA